MKNVLLLIAAILVPVGAAQGKVSRNAVRLGPTYCLIDSAKCLCGAYDDLGNGSCECRHSHGRIVRQFEAAQTNRCP
jgi:hypothetical protein